MGHCSSVCFDFDSPSAVLDTLENVVCAGVQVFAKCNGASFADFGDDPFLDISNEFQEVVAELAHILKGIFAVAARDTSVGHFVWKFWELWEF